MQRRLLGSVVFALIIGIFGMVLLLPYFADGAGAGILQLPHNIEGLNLAKVTSGKEAQEQINKLHGAKIRSLESHVALYKSEAEHMVVWMTLSSTREEAENMFRSMDALMPRSAVFTNYQKGSWEDISYCSVVGLGMEHFYYLQDRLVIWMGIVSPRSDRLFQKAVKDFQGLDK